MTQKIRTRKYWRAEIPEVPPSANVLLRTHFRERKTKREVWYALLYGAFFHEGITKATVKRTVTISIRSKNERDHANNYLGADKLILDNLRRLGFIRDDSPKWVEVVIHAEVGEPRTIVEVSE
jgi:Holliday junction resolvase RusA-like endonuclease